MPEVEPTDLLVLGDVRQVQAYVLETPYLAQMRGASRLLEKLDAKVEAEVDRLGDAGARIEIGAGGTYRIRVRDRELGLALMDRMVEHFRELTGLPPDRFATVLAQRGSHSGPTAYERLAEVKAGAGSLLASGHGLMEPCGFCGLRPAEQMVRRAKGSDASEPVASCGVCCLRLRGGRGTGRSDATKNIWELLGWTDEWLDRIGTDITAFATSGARPPGYVGVLVADGDSMGELFREAAARGKGEDSELSRALRSAVEKAAVRAADAASSPGESRPGIMPQWVAADDAVLVVQPQYALRAALTFCETFSSEMSNFLEGRARPTMSAGLVIAHASHPMSALRHLGHELLGLAKAQARKWAARSGTDRYGGVAFRLVHSSVAPRLDGPGMTACRAYPVTGEGIRLASGAWDLRRLLDAADRLVELGAPRGYVRSFELSRAEGDGPAAKRKLRREDVLREEEVRALLEASRDAGGMSSLADLKVAFELARAAATQSGQAPEHSGDSVPRAGTRQAGAGER